ncbi:MAG: hypothetical protein ACRDS1_01450 [Pseudonocardiaceae bacterium]
MTMATFRCERFPQGHINTTEGIVHFRNGVADVEDEALAEALRDAPEVFGVTEDAPPPRRPAKGAGGPTKRS